MLKIVSVKFFIILIISCGLFTQQKTQIKNDSLIFHPDFKAVYWFQHSAEMRALFYQAYNLATLKLEQNANLKTLRPRAIILDLDETVLDNSPHQAYATQNFAPYPEGWKEWINLASADALPGAKEFLLKAEKLGFTAFYISNRTDAEKLKTIENLKKLGIPFADETHVLTKSKTSDKSTRRESVAKDFQIELLIGDNLGDFDQIFQAKANYLRKAEVEKLKDEFGRKFIIVPNPLYGEWEAAGINYKPNLPYYEKQKILNDSLNVFKF